jgi:uncharacterized protein Usg
MADLLIQINPLGPRVLTTAEILYYFPDYPDLLQQYIWQDYDIAPQFPTLKQFLTFWKNNIEGQLHSVRVANVQHIISDSVLIKPYEISH